MGHVDDRPQEAGRVGHEAVAGEDGIHEDRRRRRSVPAQVRDRRFHARGERPARRLGVALRGPGGDTARTCAPSGSFGPRLGDTSAAAAVMPW